MKQSGHANGKLALFGGGMGGGKRKGRERWTLTRFIRYIILSLSLRPPNIFRAAADFAAFPIATFPLPQHASCISYESANGWNVWRGTWHLCTLDGLYIAGEGFRRIRFAMMMRLNKRHPSFALYLSNTSRRYLETYLCYNCRRVFHLHQHRLLPLDEVSAIIHESRVQLKIYINSPRHFCAPSTFQTREYFLFRLYESRSLFPRNFSRPTTSVCWWKMLSRVSRCQANLACLILRTLEYLS